MPTVVLVGTLDTKGQEYQFVKDCLLDSGVDVLVIDIGVLGEACFEPDVSAADVAESVGWKLEDLRFTREGTDTRKVALDVMADGLGVQLKRLYDEGKCHAVLGMGGSGGSTTISKGMRSLPLGVPKLLVSTMMAGNVESYVSNRDLTMMYSVTDIAGLNRFSRLILANAAHAAAGLAQGLDKSMAFATSGSKPLVALSMFGITTPGVLRMRDRLEAAGFETVVFHATGSGGKSMEDLIRGGMIDGLIDATLAELCDELLGGIFSAGPTRLTAAGEMGIPQVVIPGAIEVLNFGPRNSVPEKFDVPERKLIVHNDNVCAVRALDDELVELANRMTSRLSGATGPTAVVLPLKGLDRYGEPDGPWDDPERDAILFETIEQNLNPSIPLHKLDFHINEPEFADAVVDLFLSLWEERSKGGGSQ
ncbi:MAG: Tm-1-like ATP-binding domain-containing protein [Limnochordia bacterium]|jgi:uncharacterized protein (UPF0261 family)